MTVRVVGFFCEDIREEKSGQLSIIGIMPDNLNIPAPPSVKEGTERAQGILPKLGLYVRAQIGLEDAPGPMEISLIFPDGNTLKLSSFDADLIEAAKRQSKENGLPIAGMVSHAVLVVVPVTGPGKFLAVVDAKEGRQTRAALNLVVAE